MNLTPLLDRFIALFRKKQLEEELDEEIRAHIDLATEENLRRGLSPEDARREARRSFGGVDQMKEVYRDRRGIPLVESLIGDLRYVLRTLRRSPGFAVISIGTLALGVGANAAIFSAVNALLFRPSGVAEPERVVAVRMKVERLNIANSVISPPDFTSVRDSKGVFESAAIARPADFNYAAGDFPERLAGLGVSWQWFEVLGAKPILGRTFMPEEDRPNSNQVVILTQSAWQRLFRGDPSIVEKTIQLNQVPYKVIGIMGPDQNHGIDVGGGLRATQDVFVPLGLPDRAYSPRNRFNQSFIGIARLRRGVTFQKGQAFMGVLTERGLQDPFGDQARQSGWKLFLIPYTEFIGGELKTPMFVLSAAIGFVLLIACSNIAGLMLARSSARSREFAVRRALGADRRHLITQTAVESTILAFGGTIVGLGVAYACIRAAMVMAPKAVIGGLDIRLDVPVLLFTIGVSIVSGFLFGIAPALQIALRRGDDLLKDGARSNTVGRGRSRLRSILVTAEVSLALVLLVGAGLFLRSLVQLSQVDLGFQPEGVISGMVTLADARYRDPQRQIAFYRAAVDRMTGLPGITSAAAAITIPPYTGGAGNLQILGRQTPEGVPLPHVFVRWVTPGFFSTLRVPLKKGRLFTDLDTTGTQEVAIIDEVAAQQYWPNEDPIGQQIQRTDGSKPVTIIGIVGHVKPSALNDIAKGTVYHPLYQRPVTTAALLMRTDSDPAGLGSGLKEAVRSIDPIQPVFDLLTMEERVGTALAVRRFAVVLLAVFAGIALFMAALGLYGIVSYLVTQRTQEIGIRIALGARRGQVLRLVLTQGLRMTVIGIVIGLAAAVALARLVSNELFQVRIFDPVTLSSMAIILVAVALLATYIPARRATRIDPLQACRYE